MSETDSGDTRLEIQTRIAEMVVDYLLVPMIVAGHIDLDRAIERLERGVAVALGDTGEAKRLLGQHIQRSDRWIHEKLKAARDAAADASSQNEKGGTAGEARDSCARSCWPTLSSIPIRWGWTRCMRC